MTGPLDLSLATSALIWYFSGYKTELAVFWFFILYTIGYAIAADVGDEAAVSYN